MLHHLRKIFSESSVEICQIEWRNPHFQTHQPELEYKLITYGHSLTQEILGRLITSPDYTVRTSGRNLTEALPEHERRVAEARRQIRYDFPESEPKPKPESTLNLEP